MLQEDFLNRSGNFLQKCFSVAPVKSLLYVENCMEMKKKMD